MPISTMTSNGRVTIPKRIRERLGLHRGDRLGFQAEEDGTLRVRPIRRKVAEVFGVLADQRRRPRKTLEIDQRLSKVLGKRRK